MAYVVSIIGVLAYAPFPAASTGTINLPSDLKVGDYVFFQRFTYSSIGDNANSSPFLPVIPGNTVSNPGLVIEYSRITAAVAAGTAITVPVGCLVFKVSGLPPTISTSATVRSGTFGININGPSSATSSKTITDGNSHVLVGVGDILTYLLKDGYAGGGSVPNTLVPPTISCTDSTWTSLGVSDDIGDTGGKGFGNLDDWWTDSEMGVFYKIVKGPTTYTFPVSGNDIPAHQTTNDYHTPPVVVEEQGGHVGCEIIDITYQEKGNVETIQDEARLHEYVAAQTSVAGYDEVFLNRYSLNSAKKYVQDASTLIGSVGNPTDEPQIIACHSPSIARLPGNSISLMWAARVQAVDPITFDVTWTWTVFHVRCSPPMDFGGSGVRMPTGFPGSGDVTLPQGVKYLQDIGDGSLVAHTVDKHGRIVALVYNPDLADWQCYVGLLDSGGATYTFSAPEVAHLTDSDTVKGNLLCLPDGTFQFTYVATSGATKLVRCKNLTNEAIGTWN